MPYLFDTDAVSEVLRRRPAPRYLAWLGGVQKAEQFTSAVTIAELFEGAFRLSDPAPLVARIETAVVPALTVLGFDERAARTFGQIAAALRNAGAPLADMDLQIAATAITHDLELVTGNPRHFARVPGLRISRAFADSRQP